jgi:hypothetical protein
MCGNNIRLRIVTERKVITQLKEFRYLGNGRGKLNKIHKYTVE